MDKLTEFEELMQPIDTVVSMVFKRELQNAINIIFNNYKESSIYNNSSQEDIDKCVKVGIERCLNLISKNYRKKVIKKVFTDDGIIYYLYMSLYTLTLSSLEDKISSIPT